MSVIKITCGGDSMIAELLPQSAPETIESLLSSLPISSSAKRWDDDVYFTVPIEADSENQSDRCRATHWYSRNVDDGDRVVVEGVE